VELLIDLFYSTGYRGGNPLSMGTTIAQGELVV
jgi:hypothetical protein